MTHIRSPIRTRPIRGGSMAVETNNASVNMTSAIVSTHIVSTPPSPFSLPGNPVD